MLDDKKSSDLNRYLDEKMTDQEKAIFEMTISNNTDLSDELKIRQKAMDAIQQEKYRLLRNELIDRGKNKLKTSSQPRRIALVAATIALLLLPLYFYQQSFKTTTFASLEDLAQEMERPDLRELSERAVETDKTTDLEWLNILDAFEAGKYQELIPILQPRTPFNTENAQISKLALAYCLLTTGQPAEAIPYFQQVSTRYSVFQQAQWYQALAHLQLQEREAAQALFQAIAEYPKHPHYMEAREMLVVLERRGEVEI